MRSAAKQARSHGGLAVVAGVAAEAALVDQALRGAVEGQAEVLELDDRVDRLPAHDLRRRLVDQVVAALDRVEGVPLPGVLLHVGQGRAHPALGRAGVGSGGVQLGEHGRAALPGRLDGGPQPGPPGPDDHRVEAVPVDLHRRHPLTCACAALPPNRATLPLTKLGSALLCLRASDVTTTMGCRHPVQAHGSPREVMRHSCRTTAGTMPMRQVPTAASTGQEGRVVGDRRQPDGGLRAMSGSRSDNSGLVWTLEEPVRVCSP